MSLKDMLNKGMSTAAKRASYSADRLASEARSSGEREKAEYFKQKSQEYKDYGKKFE